MTAKFGSSGHTVSADVWASRGLPALVGASVAAVKLLIFEVAESIILTCPALRAALHAVAGTTGDIVFL